MARVTPGTIASLALLFVAGATCSRGPAPIASVSRTPVVASVAGTPIFAADVSVQMRRNGSDRASALDALITFEALATAAAAAGTEAADEADAAERAALQAVKVQRLVEREIEPRLARETIGEVEIRSLYDRGRSRFEHGRLVEVAVLAVFTGARMKPEPRARAEATARQLRTLLDGRGVVTARTFEEISKDPVWIERKVSFTTTWQADDQPFPAVVGRAVQSLTKPGAITGLVGDETGYYIALYLSEKPPAHVSFQEAAPILREEMYEPWRRQKFLQLALAFAQGHDIEVFPENFPALAERR